MIRAHLGSWVFPSGNRVDVDLEPDELAVPIGRLLSDSLPGDSV